MSAAPAWDYLILTASNSRQAEAYENQLGLRRERGRLQSIRNVLVVPDLDGRRVGSGGSTLFCLLEVLVRERGRHPEATPEAILQGLRILIVHAGGDSRRLPAYGPCGKIFIPLPDDGSDPLPHTLFDRLMPQFLKLPAASSGRGQIVVAAGDALLQFDASSIRLHQPGITVLAGYATPQEASRHGVFCLGASGEARLYLQKPPEAVQRAEGAINESGQTALDLGVMSLDAESAAALLRIFGPSTESGRARILRYGLDLYREICCAMGSNATLDHYMRCARSSGSGWPEEELAAVYGGLRAITFHIETARKCGFLHFGSTRQLIESGVALVSQDRGRPVDEGALVLNTAVSSKGKISGHPGWVEGCRISAPLVLSGRNAIVGVDVARALTLPPLACLDVLQGSRRDGSPGWFVRCYGIEDTFKHTVEEGGCFCGRPLLEWLLAAGIDRGDVWPYAGDTPRSLWNARVFPCEESPDGFRRWLWMYASENATAAEKAAYASADRYSAEEIALYADQPAFHTRRLETRSSLGR
ncbi:MAG: L-fucokinase [Bryobacteraceae bacterium]